MPLRRLVLDVLMPHAPGVVAYAERLSALDGVEGVGIDVLEEDVETKSVEITLEGPQLPFEDIKASIEELGGAVHSVDQVSSGVRTVLSRVIPREWE